MPASTHARTGAPAGTRRSWKAPALALTVLGVAASSCLVTAPAGATVSGPGVQPGANITVFHNINMVAAFGFVDVGQPMTVQVVRAGAVVGTTSGKALATDEGPGLEVNHGVDAGTPEPGECWTTRVPDIRPGDQVQVIADGRTGQVTVDNLQYTADPVVADNGDVVVKGQANEGIDGPAIPASALDAAEFRSEDGKYRATPKVRQTGANGEFELRYAAPYTGDRNRNGLTEARRQTALKGEGHAVGFGHVEPLPRDTQILDGTGYTTAPAPGCGGTAPEPDPDPGPDPIFTPDPPPVTPTDRVAPTVKAKSPAPNARNVSRHANIPATFSEHVSDSTLSKNFVLRKDSTGAVVPAARRYDAIKHVTTLNPSSALRSGRYTVTLTSGMKDAAGNPLAKTTWSFRV